MRIAQPVSLEGIRKDWGSRAPEIRIGQRVSFSSLCCVDCVDLDFREPRKCRAIGRRGWPACLGYVWSRRCVDASRRRPVVYLACLDPDVGPARHIFRIRIESEKRIWNEFVA